jgi:hypothetical protein
MNTSRFTYEKVGPWNLAKLNATILNKEKTRLRILAGERDSRLQPTLHEYHEWLKRLNIGHALIMVEGAGHEYGDILEGYGQDTFAFWTSAFGDLQ